MRFDLPTLPGTQARALALVSAHDIAIEDVAQVVETDPALTASLIRAANSAASAPVTRVGTVKQAVIRVGLQQTRRIVAAAVVGNTFTGLQRAQLDARELWRHVVACALLADITAFGELQQSVAFTAGLLHDIGRLAMAHQQPVRYAEVVRLTRDGLDPPWAESRVFGVDHMQLGIAAARAWQIPDEIVDAIGDHHFGTGGALSWVVWNSRRIAWALGIGDGIDQPTDPPSDPTPEDAHVLQALGGPATFLSTVDWFCGAVAPAVRAA